MTSSQRIAVTGESHVGAARRFVAEVCARLSDDDTFCGRVALVITELARNLVRHGGGGEIILRQLSNPGALELLAIDRGPGLRNVAECFRDGFSTAGTMGTGLGAVKRLSDRFEVYTQRGAGTVAWAWLSLSRAESDQGTFDCSGVSVAVGQEELCGDSWDILETEGILRAIVVDGLGHGPLAEHASREAVAIFRSQRKTGVASTLKLIDLALMKTRGAAGAIVELNPRNGSVTAAGVGNISTRLLHNGQSKCFGCDNGTLGTGLKRINEFKHPWAQGTLLVMHSDGIKSRWSFDEYPGISMRHPGLVAGLLYRDFRRGGDDTTVIAVGQRL